MQQDNNQMLQSMYDDYLVALKKFALAKGVNYNDVEDVVQETIISYYENYPLDWPEERKKPMLLRILCNKSIDLYRKNHRCQKISIDNAIGEFELLCHHIVRDSLEDIINNEIYKEIRAFISNMKGNWRDVIILSVIEERSVKEICDILNITGTVCRSRISRAKKHLREELGGRYML